MRSFLVWLLLMNAMAASQELVVADFESQIPVPLQAKNATAEISSEEPAQGQAFLRLDLTGQRAYVRLPVGVGFAGRDRLSAAFRTPVAVELRWLALDRRGRPIFQRRFRLEGSEKWIRLEEPLRDWRWDDQRVGRWPEVRELALRVESSASRIDVDDIRLLGVETAEDRAKWLVQLAFGDRQLRIARQDDLLVATDAIDAFPDDDLHRLLKQMHQARQFVRRVFGQAVCTEQEPMPIALLIFADEANREDFLSRLGRQWRVQIAPPAAQGYTVQDIATAVHRAELGVRRPVFLHEAVHAIVARELGLLVSHDPHTPIQEGIANYVQLCVHPESLDRQTYIRNFRGEIDPSGRGFFKPLELLFAGRATAERYAQLASVTAYMVEHDQPLLNELVNGLAEGRTAGEVLASHGLSWQRFQEGWQSWGRRKFVGQRPTDSLLFDPPAEFRLGDVQ